ncbi:MAG: GTP-binding protein [Bacteroidales bacterium]|nr:GTP-binding protein [Bacteroidales bacterium]
MNKEQTPVLLLTGYLGSGKTTLVNKILSNKKGIKFAVIVNDIGEVNIDADLIQKGGVVGQKDESLVALQNGCICCTLKMDLVEQLRDITSQHRFDYIVIEASGICEPEPIAQTICSIPSLGEEYVADGVPYLDCIVTVVDALRLQSEFGCGDDLMKKDIDEEDLASLVIQQIEFCNVILLNKASEVSASELERIKQIIAALQPKAKIIECDYAEVDFDTILHTNLFDFESVATSATWIREVEGLDDDDDHMEAHHDEFHDDEDEHEHHHHHDDDDDDDDDDHEHDEHHHHHHHHHDHDHEGGEVEEYGIGTYVYYARKPMDINRFDWFVSKHWPKSVIRAKGLCYFATERDACYLFEQAGKQIQLKNAGLWYASMPKEQLLNAMLQNPIISKDWDTTYGDRMQKIVFIGQHLDKEEIKKNLDLCLVD